MNYLNRDEVAGVVAHELAHIKNRDTLIMTITATIAGAISMLAQFGMFFSGGNRNNNGFGIIGTLAMVILAPIAAMLVQMAISRTREYSADKLGAMIQGTPQPLISGLVKISNAAHQIENPSAEQNPATAHMFIINPLMGAHGWDNLFADPPRRPRTGSRRCSRSARRWVSAATPAGRAGAGRSSVPPTGGSQGGSPWGTRRGGPGSNEWRASPAVAKRSVIAAAVPTAPRRSVRACARRCR